MVLAVVIEDSQQAVKIIFIVWYLGLLEERTFSEDFLKHRCHTADMQYKSQLLLWINTEFEHPVTSFEHFIFMYNTAM
jgi:hypothetical protein